MLKRASECRSWGTHDCCGLHSIIVEVLAIMGTVRRLEVCLGEGEPALR